MTNEIEIYVDRFWWKMGNQDKARQMAIDKLPEGVTEYEMNEVMVKRGCAAQIKITIIYEENH